ncbi:MAG: zinc ribbon domain-containing protein [Clostridiales bacterium]|jgi:hypothetical protein|nr:zinc ribbon domain-containing protein [Clostridiales bacterium]
MPQTGSEMKFCQSCSLPMRDGGLYGDDADGSPSEDYCKYCYEKGQFLQNVSMEEMIDFVAPHMAEAAGPGVPGMTVEQARGRMREFFPHLKRWGKQ